MDYLKDNTITMYADCARICNENKLSAGQRAVYNIIYTFCTKGKKKECIQPLGYFEDWTGLSHSGVIRTLNSLEECDLIKREPFFYDNSDVERRRYTLIDVKRRLSPDYKAEIRAKTQIKIDEYYHQKKVKELKRQGLEPLPPELEGQGYRGIQVDEFGNKYLVPDATKSAVNFRQRYITKEEHDKMFSDLHNLDDVDI